MDDKDKHELETAVAAATLRVKFDQLRIEVDELWKWKKENEAVLIWAKGYMETYRNTIRVVIASGLIAALGFLLQLYATYFKGK